MWELLDVKNTPENALATSWFENCSVAFWCLAPIGNGNANAEENRNGISYTGTDRGVGMKMEI